MAILFRSKTIFGTLLGVSFGTIILFGFPTIVSGLYMATLRLGLTGAVLGSLVILAMFISSSVSTSDTMLQSCDKNQYETKQVFYFFTGAVWLCVLVILSLLFLVNPALNLIFDNKPLSFHGGFVGLTVLAMAGSIACFAKFFAYLEIGDEIDLINDILSKDP